MPGTLDRIALIKERHALRQGPLCKHRLPTTECALCRPAPVRTSEPPPPTVAPPGASSSQDYIMAAARTLTRPFSETALLLAVWQLQPRLFGLSGVAELHPDARRLAVQMFGQKGLLARGLLVRTGNGLLTVPFSS